MTTKTERYFHINNGGVSFVVEDSERGPQISVRARHFDQQTACTTISVPKAALAEMAQFFKEAAEKEYTPSSGYECAMPFDPNVPRGEMMRVTMFDGRVTVVSRD